MTLILSSILSLIVGLGLYFGVTHYNDLLAQKLVDFYPLDWGKSSLEQGAVYIVTFALSAIGFVFYKYIVLITLSPLMSYASEKIEAQVDGTSQVIEITFIKSILRGLRISIRNFSREIFYTILLLILGLIPMFTPFTSIMLVAVQAFYLGATALDYYCERHYSTRDTMLIANRERLSLAAVGLCYITVLAVPIIGVLLAPIMSTIATTELAIYRYEI